VEKKKKVLQLHHHASFLASLIIAMDKALSMLIAAQASPS
jgi:hypothetical protein